MYEVRFHGRGGQGAVTAAAMLAAALLEEGKYAVSIPSFGFERRGAPVVSFLRCSDKPIRQLTNIYAPDCLICVDPTLTRSVDIFAGLKPGGTLVQASNRPLAEVTLTPHCKLKRVIANATDAYLAELDKVTLADITETPSAARSSVIAVPVDTIRGSKVKRPNP